MPKAKLTLYIEDEVSRLAHKTAKLSGRSISKLVADFFIKKAKKASEPEISPTITGWIGAVGTSKTYKQLRGEAIDDKLKKYESAN